MLTFSSRNVRVFSSTTLLLCLSASAAAADDRRGVVFGEIGYAGIGYADSEQGKAPIFGGGLAFRLARWLVAEGDVHGARVHHVFGQDHHDFSELTFTGSLLFRTFDGPVHFIAGGGWAWQRAHSEFDVAPVGRIDRTETIRLLHGRVGAEWDLSDRVVLRTDGVLWMGGGLDWVVGGRVGVGYRF